MSTSGIGTSPAAPDHREKRSTNFDAASSRCASVILAVSDPVVSVPIRESFLVPCAASPEVDLVRPIKIDQMESTTDRAKPRFPDQDRSLCALTHTHAVC